MEARLIKIDKNGSKHWEELVTCDRCGGDGIYKWGAVIDGVPQYAGVCYKCEGVGKVWTKRIERTPEYQAKLDAKRLAKQRAKEEAEQAEADRIRMEREAEEAKRIAEEERIKAEKAVSQWVGQVGDKVNIEATYDHYAYYDFKVDWMEQRMYIHTFKDADGNKIVWKTTSNNLCEIDEGDVVQVKGTIKDHSEYRDEKQTLLTRCRVTKK